MFSHLLLFLFSLCKILSDLFTKRLAVLREQASRLRHCVFTVGALLAGAFGINGAFINAKRLTRETRCYLCVFSFTPLFLLFVQ